jgi:hypothetical protein
MALSRELRSLSRWISLSALGVFAAVSSAWWLHEVLLWSRTSSYLATYAVVFLIDVIGTIRGVFGAELRAQNIALYSLSSLLFNFLGGLIFVSLANVTGTITSLLLAQFVVFPIRYLVARKILAST